MFVCNYTPYAFMYFFVCCHLYLLSVIFVVSLRYVFRIHSSSLKNMMSTKTARIAFRSQSPSFLTSYSSSPLFFYLFILLNKSLNLHKLLASIWPYHRGGRVSYSLVLHRMKQFSYK